MPEYLGGQPGFLDKAVPIGCIVILIAFFISVPFMARDKQRYEAEQWRQQGCHMYDDYEPSKVPAKCSSYFIDHYKAQAERVQPPEAAK